jgi:hypothetical protein
MRRARNLAKSSEEKVAGRIGKELTDFSLDLEAVGMYLSKQPYIIYNRAIEVLEATEYNKNNEYNDKWKEYDEQDKF